MLGCVWGVSDRSGLGLPVAMALFTAAFAICVHFGRNSHSPAHLRRGAAAVLPWLLLTLAAAGWSSRARASPHVAGPPAGRWEPGVEIGRLGIGRVAGDARVLCVDAGAVRAGERIEVRAGGVVRRAARGPVPAPGALDGRERIDVPPEALVRVAPATSATSATPAPPAIEDLRAAWLERLDALPSPRAQALARALLLGDKSRLSSEDLDLFTRTGTRHLLALSGLHVGIVAWWIATPLGGLAAALVGAVAERGGRLARSRLAWIARPEPWRALVILFFAPLAGASPPVVRASVAFALATLAPLLPCRIARSSGAAPPSGASAAGRRVDPLSLLALALWLECLADPEAPLRLGVQLSYSATLGLIVGFSGARRVLRAALPGGGRLGEASALGRPRPAWARVAFGRAVDAALALFAASLCASLATLPVVACALGEWSPVGVVATAALVPAIVLATLGGWAWILLPGWASPAWVEGAAQAALGVLAWADRLPGTPTPLPGRPMALWGLAAGASLIALRRMGASRCGGAALRLGAAAFGACALPWAAGPKGLELVALDVGHGTAAVLRAPGEPCWVFDAGSTDRPHIGRAALGPLLRAWDVGSVDVVLSHDDRDHASALPWLVERYGVRVWAGAADARSLERLAHGCVRLDLDRGRLPLPARRPPSGLTLTLLRGGDREGNEGSRWLAATYAGEELLLAGDSEAEGLARMLDEGLLRAPVRLLLFPHHGSETPLLGRLLSVTRPREVWLSAADRPPVAAELDRRGLAWRSTATAGPLCLLLPAEAGTDRAGAHLPRPLPIPVR